MSRSSTQTVKCAVCSRILVDKIWLRERREYHVKYQFTLCAHCVVLNSHRLVRPAVHDAFGPRGVSALATRR